MSNSPSVLIYKRMNNKSPGIYTYSGPIYVESIYVEKENVISTKYESLTEKGSKSLIGLIMFIICSIFSVLVFIFGIIKYKSCSNNNMIMILITICILISIVSIILNARTLMGKRKVKAYYLKNESISTTDKRVPVIANMEERVGNKINKIFIGLSSIYVVILMILFYFIYKKCVMSSVL
jgi:hypothetical protein